MGLFTSQVEFKPIEETPSGNGDSFRGVDKFVMGAGANRLEMNIKDGFWMGADTFAIAKASIDFLGNSLFSSVTIKNENGDTLIDSNSSTADYIQIINSKLNTDSQSILSDFDFGTTDYAGAVKAGDIAWDTTTGAITGGSGVVVYRKGIVGANAGVATFTLDATTGNATLAGTLSAASGTLGAITLATGGNIKAGKTAYLDDTNAGFWLGLDSGTPKFNIGSSASKYFHYDGTNFSMLGGTITGGIVQTATTGYNVKLEGAKVSLRTATSEIGYLAGITGDYTNLHGNNALFLSAEDGLYLTYNDDGGEDGLVFYNDETVVAYFDDSNNFVMNTGSIQCGSTFKSSDGTSGGNYTAYGFVTDPWTPKWREITVKDGLIVNISSEKT